MIFIRTTQYDEVIYEEEIEEEDDDDGDGVVGMSSRTVVKTKRRKGKRDSGLSFMDGISQVTSSTEKPPNSPPTYARTQFQDVIIDLAINGHLTSLELL